MLGCRSAFLHSGLDPKVSESAVFDIGFFLGFSEDFCLEQVGGFSPDFRVFLHLLVHTFELV